MQYSSHYADDIAGEEV